MISVERSFFERFPRLAHGRARVLSRPVVEVLRAVACEERINRALAELTPYSGFAFIERVLDAFAIGYRIAHDERENIPAEGRAIIVANHPLGAFDALVLLHLVGSVRRDVRIIANDVLAQVAPLAGLLLPVNVFGSGDASAGRLRAVYRALEAEQAVIVFPSGEVSRVAPHGVRDGRWSPGFVRFARRSGAPVVPVHVAAHNSATFYGVSMLARPLSSLLLAREMFGAARSRPAVVVGQLVPARALADAAAPVVAATMRRHVYRIGRHRPGLFATARAVGHPESPRAVREALRGAEVLGTLADGRRVLLVDVDADSPVLREIGRLRELAFRRVGEGTGARRDTDRFDLHYRHLVLWDEQALAIAGAYRLGEGERILPARGLGGLYSATLFDYADGAREFVAQGVELGRSFIQPAYWNSRSLDSLWQGIGAYLKSRPQVRYLFGPVSISAQLPEPARHWMVHFHRHYFADRDRVAVARNRFEIRDEVAAEANALWRDQDLRSAQSLLKRRLAALGAQLPVLYKHYVDLCEPAGVRFLDFGRDPAFGDCVDGLIRLDLAALRPARRERYLGT